jgi:DNA-binding Lrp family transcriptional regulator
MALRPIRIVPVQPTAQSSTRRYGVQSKAYVLIEVDAGQIAAVLAALRAIPGVVAADPVTGPHDVILVIETDDQRTIGRILMDSIHTTPGVKRTITCLAI